MVLSEKLAALRKEHGYSQLYVAERLNVSRQAISRWEVGSSVPSTENLLELSRLYGVSLDELVDHGTEKETPPAPEFQSEQSAPTEPMAQPQNPDVFVIPKKRLYVACAMVCLVFLCLLAICLWRATCSKNGDVVDIDSIQNEGIVTPDGTFEFAD